MRPCASGQSHSRPGAGAGGGGVVVVGQRGAVVLLLLQLPLWGRRTTTPQQHTQSLRRSSCVRQRTTPASTQCTASSCGSGVDDDGQCDGGEFELKTASVVAEAAVERKEIRRVRPLLSELQVPEWQERAGSGPAEVEKGAEGHRYSLVLQAQGVGLFAQRYRVGQPRAQTEGQGNCQELGWRPAPQAGQSGLRVVGGGQLANTAAAPPSEGRPPSAGRVHVAGATRQGKARKEVGLAVHKPPAPQQKGRALYPQ
jgi:hypothetical protein